MTKAIRVLQRHESGDYYTLPEVYGEQAFRRYKDAGYDFPEVVCALCDTTAWDRLWVTDGGEDWFALGDCCVEASDEYILEIG